MEGIHGAMKAIYDLVMRQTHYTQKAQIYLSEFTSPTCIVCSANLTKAIDTKPCMRMPLNKNIFHCNTL